MNKYFFNIIYTSIIQQKNDFDGRASESVRNVQKMNNKIILDPKINIKPYFTFICYFKNHDFFINFILNLIKC